MDYVHRVFISRFSTLPVEIRQAILFEMPDLDTLRTAIDADESLESAFRNNESAILDRVLHKTINSRLIPEVLAVLEATRIRSDGSWSEERVREFLERYSQRRSFSISWKLPDAIAIHEIHDHIRFFVDDFACQALSVHLVTGDAQRFPVPLSQNERCRIEAAFFRFELYCNLPRKLSTQQNYFTSYEMRDIFLSSFSPWEFEQLACVHAYLTDKMLIPFKEVAEHYERCEKQPLFVDETGVLDERFYVQGVMTSGLPHLRYLLTENFYKNIYNFFRLNPLPRGHHHYVVEDFLLGSLLCYQFSDEDIPLSELSEEAKEALVSKSSTEEPDPGPYNAWYWAHKDRSYYEPVRCFLDEAYEVLRRRSYVMWDEWRLRERGLFNKPFDEADYLLPEDQRTEQRPHEVENS